MVTSNVIAWPAAVDTNWRAQGKCVRPGVDPDIFFPVNDEDPNAIDNAKAVCAGCPVLDDCRAHALSVGEPFGIWGGMSLAERREALGRSVFVDASLSQQSHDTVTVLPMPAAPAEVAAS